jgi:hypothetical protein
MTTSIPDRRFNGLVKKSETMYELSRHITHARETLKVAADTLETIENYRGAFYASIPSGISAEVFRFFSSYLTNLERRAESFEHRLQNEMQLVITWTLASIRVRLLIHVRCITLFLRKKLRNRGVHWMVW